RKIGGFPMRLVRDTDWMDMQEQDATADSNDRFKPEEPDGAIDPAVDAADEPSESDQQADLGILEALLFGTHHPLTAGRLAELMDLDSTKPIRRAVKQLNEQYEQAGRCFRVDQVAGGFQLLTLPEYGQ